MRNLKHLMIVAIVALIVFCLPASAAEPDKKPKEKMEYRDKKQRGKRYTRPRAIRDKDFDMMVGIVKNASFDDKKIDVMRVACIGSYFSSRQCAKLLSLLSFDDNKIKALEVIASRLVDKNNADDIVKEFSFSSSKDKAVSILQRRKK
ncbi:MAG: DUF4476 domain-containing protein [Bacteroidaceae bacterium]|nr:DUF4476 domain-containing protein [Bacteroidaceae bacterium]